MNVMRSTLSKPRILHTTNKYCKINKYTTVVLYRLVHPIEALKQMDK
jgi:hypothetical protein